MHKLFLRLSSIAVVTCRRFPSTFRVTVFLLVACLAPDAWALSIERMTINGRINPMSIAADDISFAWAIAAQERGVVQSAYRIRVGTTENGSDVWDSGRMASDRQIDITLPSDLRLAPETRYYWQVK